MWPCARVNRGRLVWGFTHPMKLELQSQDRTVIYASDTGYCCIEQHGIEGSHLVAISADKVDEFCRMLLSVKEQAAKNREQYLKEEGEQ